MIRKKVIAISLILSITLINLLSFSAFSLTRDKSNSNSEIKTLISLYFDKNNISVNQSSDEDYSGIICNNKFKDLVAINNDYFRNLYKGLNEKIVSRTYNLIYNSIVNDGNRCIVNVDKDLTTIYTLGDSNTTNTYNMVENNIFELKNISGKWYINNNVNDPLGDADISDLNDKNIDAQYSSTKYQFDNINNIVKTLKSMKASENQTSTQIINNTNDQTSTQNSITPNVFSGNVPYYRTDAVNYAYKWVNSYNPQFPNWLSPADGNHDCTNFVSQCINYGGLGQNSSWYCNSKTDVTSSWINVDSLYNYLTGHNLVKSTQTSPTYYNMDIQNSQASIGDVIQFCKKTDPLGMITSWTHTALITTLTGSGAGTTIHYTAHSNTNTNKSIFDLWNASSDYPYIRILHINY